MTLVPWIKEVTYKVQDYISILEYFVGTFVKALLMANKYSRQQHKPKREVAVGNYGSSIDNASLERIY